MPTDPPQQAPVPSARQDSGAHVSAAARAPSPGTGNRARWLWGALCGAYFVVAMALSTAPISSDQSKGIMIWLSLLGIALSLAWARLPRQAAHAALLVLTLIAIGNYLRWGPGVLTHIDKHDVIHYYLGAKYFAELSNFDLYPALAAVDEDHGRWRGSRRRYWHTTPAGFEQRPIGDAVKRGRQVQRERFSPARWQEFEQDALFLRRFIGRHHFRAVLGDKGFNATPAWAAYARPIAQAVPVTWLKALCLLDVALLAAALAAVGWAYGSVAVLFGLFYLSVTISLRWLTPGIVFLRYDWLSALVIAMCLLKRRQHLWAGVFAGLSGVLRYFPVVWMWGPACKGVIALLRPPGAAPTGSLRVAANKPVALGALLRSRVDRRLLRFGLAFALSLLALQGLATWSVGWGAVTDHWAKIRAHVAPEMISSKRPGFPIAASYDGKASPPALNSERRADMRAQRPVRTLVALGLMLLLGVGLARRPDDEAFAFGYIPFFLLTTATYYYHVCRLTLVVAHAAAPDRLRNRVGLAMLLAMEVWSNWSTTAHPRREVMWTGWLSWSLTAYSLVMIAWLLWEARAAHRSPQPEHADPQPRTAEA